ncbi:TetR/AcrR family transcriptional regulator [Corynebacterium breve]|uniref:TetR/AcrR family transcriptional regulator n=1 Tax=Corynebacterium breve TaxID=3049799 RepID=A0ABY8VBY2_9CORY|nr:TetR/AcrR family transcriptional regulator [Corynebacterium breve]WIM67179.1 TetR/AcrR family transcriptional regulator [Corynebacterium breve]
MSTPHEDETPSVKAYESTPASPANFADSKLVEVPEETATPEDVITIALHRFAIQGFQETKLDAISKESGMSKRMIHYHFGDKRGLYHRTLATALSNLQPPTEVHNRSFTVPVEGVRRFVDAMFYRMVEEPESLRLVLRESLEPVLDLVEMSAISDASELTLHLERLLLMGQDVGAFRPGISTHDLLALILALGSYRVTGHDLTVNLFDIDLQSRENTEGMRRFVIDAVLAFLTSNISDSGYSSYLVQRAPTPSPISNDEVYGFEKDIY